MVIMGNSTTCSVTESSRRDCGYLGIDATTCQSKGCCWAQSSSGNVPWCFFPHGDAAMIIALTNVGRTGSTQTVTIPSLGNEGNSLLFCLFFFWLLGTEAHPAFSLLAFVNVHNSAEQLYVSSTTTFSVQLTAGEPKVFIPK